MTETMSGGKAQQQSATPAPTIVGGKAFWKPCAILLDGPHGFIVGGKKLGVQGPDIETTLVFSKAQDSTAWMGFAMEFPLGSVDQNEGFGICHKRE